MSCLLNLQARDTYFMESGDKIRYFFEEGALNEKGELIVDKQRCLNKIGHVRYQYSFEFFQLWKWPTNFLLFKGIALAWSRFQTGEFQYSSEEYTKGYRIQRSCYRPEHVIKKFFFKYILDRR